MKEIKNESGWRGSPEVWLQAAYEALLESGIDSVKIQLLAKKLKLARASFYWYFKDRDDLLNALIDVWRNKNTHNFIKRTEAYADNQIEAILNVSDCWFDDRLFDSKLEFSMRGWALQSTEVLEQVQKADQIRIDALTQMFCRFGLSEIAAGVRARTIYQLQIGYISMQLNESLDLRMSRMPEYLKVFTGIEPESKELQRFFARHGVSIAC
jgi:AcrR family transcriptional regulator